MICVWCEQDGAQKTTKNCTWIEPGGRDVIEVTDVPAIKCETCQDTYLEDSMNDKVEEALHTVELEKLGQRFSYKQLMEAPKVSIFEMYLKGKEMKSCP